MKRSVSILLLAIFLCKMGGYDVLFWFMKRQAMNEERERAWTNSDKEGIQHRRIAMPLPYMQPQTFASVGDLVEQNGEFFRIVALNWENDTLNFYYRKDPNLKVFADSMNEYKSLRDDQQQSSSPKIPPGFLKEYQGCKAADLESRLAWAMELESCAFDPFVPLVNAHVDTPPPKSTSSFT